MLELSAAKPNPASNLESSVLYLVNLNKEILECTINLQHTSLPDADAWSFTPARFSIAPGGFEKVLVSVLSEGVEPKLYASNTIQFAAYTENSLPTNRSLEVSVDIHSTADTSQTQVNVTGQPTLNEPWSGITIHPLDSDGYPVSTYTAKDDFAITLHYSNKNQSQSETTCETVWSETNKFYTATCVVPGTSRAGIWIIEARLNGDVFFTSNMHVWCASGYFENPDPDFACEKCPSHDAERASTICPAGTTLGELPVSAGYWRSGESSVQLIDWESVQSDLASLSTRCAVKGRPKM